MFFWFCLGHDCLSFGLGLDWDSNLFGLSLDSVLLLAELDDSPVRYLLPDLIREERLFARVVWIFKDYSGLFLSAPDVNILNAGYSAYCKHPLAGPVRCCFRYQAVMFPVRKH